MKFSSKALSRFKHIAPKRLRTLVLVVCVLNLSQLQAGVLFTFVEDGGNVVATTSGTIAAGWSSNFPVQGSTSDEGVVRYDSIRGTRTGEGMVYYMSIGLWELDEMLTRDPSDPANSNGVTTGDTFGYAGNGNFYVPTGTGQGDAITPNTTITWAGATFESLGLDTGLSTTPLVLFTLDNSETISAVRGASGGGAAVPEPSSLALLGCGVVVTTGLRRLRSKKRG